MLQARHDAHAVRPILAGFILFASATLAQAQAELPEGAAIRIGTVAERRDDSPISHVAFSPDGKALAWPGFSDTVRLFDPVKGNELSRLEGHRGLVTPVVFSPDGKLIATGGRNLDNTIRIWNRADGKEAARLVGHRSGVYSLAFSPDGKLLASGGGSHDNFKDYLVRIWDVGTGKLIHEINGPTARIASLAFSPEGKTLAVGSWAAASSVTLWDVTSGNLVRGIPFRAKVWSVAFSPDGKTLAAGAYLGDGSLCCLFDASTGNKLHEIGDDNLVVMALAFSPDGKTLATGSRDGPLYLWETATAQQRRRLALDCIGVASLAFSPDGKKLAAGCYDTTALVWKLTSLVPHKQRDPELLWGDLTSDDPARSYDAILALADIPDKSLPFVQGRLRAERQPPEAKTVARLIAELDDNRFAVREKAASELEKLGKAAGPALRAALKGDLSSEVRQRIEGLLRLHERDTIRFVRAIEVLEQIGTAEARDVLEKAVPEAPGEREKAEAKAALDRLQRRVGK